MLLPDYVKRLQSSHATRQTLWQEYRAVYPTGYSYSQFCEHVSAYLGQQKVVMHIEHRPGDVLQIDFAGDNLCYFDPQNHTTVESPVLVCTLPHSSFCYAEALRDMSQPELIRALNRCMEYLHGVPHNLCTDNLKQVVTKSDKYEPQFSELMLRFALHYNTSLFATRVAKPRDKASVERHVSIIYTSIYAQMEKRHYNSLSELNAELRKLLDRLNDKPMQKIGISRRSLFEQHELPVLRPLPNTPFEIKCRTQAKVQSNYHVVLGKDWHNYSVPYQYTGKRVVIEYDTETVEIYYSMKIIALHRRCYTKNGYSTLPEHVPANHKVTLMLQGTSPEELIDKSKEIGCNTELYIKMILNTKFFSQQNIKSCLGILRLAKSHGNQRLERAYQIALVGVELNYKTIKNILENRSDEISQQAVDYSVTQEVHANVRGADFYFNLFKN